MKRRIQGQQKKSFYLLRLGVLEPQELAGRVVSGRLYCTSKSLWKLGWFLRDFLYDPDLSPTRRSMKKPFPVSRGVVKISQYLACPRRYRYGYLDGWREKDTRAAMLFGRAFEQAFSCLLPARRSC
jgi:hypothetical protein